MFAITYLARFQMIRLLIILFISPTIMAAAPFYESPQNGDSLIYYKIGGAHTVPLPAAMTSVTIPINFSLSLSTPGMNCGNFDPQISIADTLNDIQSGIDDTLNQIQAAAGAAVTALPGYMLQKANPGFYALLQNSIFKIQEEFQLSVKSCEQIGAELANGIDPYEQWAKISVGERWKAEIGTGGNAIVSAENVASTNGDLGLRWINGIQSGGAGQPEINIFQDTGLVGFNMLVGRGDPASITSTAPITASDNSISRIWDDPDDAIDWIVEVLGDSIITTHSTGNKAGVPGKGLIPKVDERRREIIATFNDIYTGVVDPTPSVLSEISAPGIATTYQLIRAMGNAGPEMVGWAGNRLAEDIAIAQIAEEAVMARRILLTGKREGYISANKLAVDEIEKGINELDKYLEDILFEKDIRLRIATNTAQEVLRYDHANMVNTFGIPTNEKVNDQPFLDGKVDP